MNGYFHRVALLLPALTVILFTWSSPLHAELPPVKLSSGGICHSQDSAWYARTKSYVAFRDLTECLEEGGRLPAGHSPVSSGMHPRDDNGPQNYDRRAFGSGWVDANKDCRDARAEALIDTSTLPVAFAREEGCRVVAGRWISPFTGNVIQNASDIDIDHVVPLSYAWRSGAWQWTDEDRIRFANDRVNLLPVEASLNRSKGDRPPSEWLPPAGQCQYVARFYRITKLYALEPGDRERDFIKSFLSRCRSTNNS